MAIIKCKMCGGDLRWSDGASTATCEYCGSVQTVPVMDDEKKLTLFSRANRLRFACEFDKAAGIYESIVADFPEEAEAYWGLVLCKYGIEYVDDPGTGKKIPTCHRSSFDSIMDDSDFEQACENADAVARRVYRDEAKAIEEIRKGIITVSSKEAPYDIFICYKETDDNGNRTLDSVLAQDIYDALTAKGYRTFFSRISLEDKLGLEYEPYIFAALNSAKIMLAVGTDYEYYNAVWVKNEWSRFLKLIAKDNTKHLIPCYKGIDAYDMPKEFAKLQAQDMGKIGAMQDLLRGVDKLLVKAEAVALVHTSVTVGGDSKARADALVTRGNMALEDGDWAQADKFFEEALNNDPKNGYAYLGKLMNELKVCQQAELSDVKGSFEDNGNYKKALRFADEPLRKVLEDSIDAIKKRKELERIAQQKREEKEKLIRQEKEETAQLARQKQEEAERAAREENARKLLNVRNKIFAAQMLVSNEGYRTWGVCSNGTVLSTNHILNLLSVDKQRDVAEWRDIIAISSGMYHTVGLRVDGTVTYTNYPSKFCYPQDGVVDWKNIVAISAGRDHTIGLQSDGSIIAIGNPAYGQCSVRDWRDIVAVSAGTYHSVGLRVDGTVVATKYIAKKDYYCGQCDVTEWRDIIAISAGGTHTVGLRADGTVIATKYTGKHYHGQCDVNNWRDIVAISAGDSYTVGLRADGTVEATGYNDYGQCNVKGWRNIAAIYTGHFHTVGLLTDGTVVSTASSLRIDNDSTLIRWNLFHDFDNLAHEQQQKQNDYRVARKRRDANKCQYCGGDFRGFLFPKCINCGKSKDY